MKTPTSVNSVKLQNVSIFKCSLEILITVNMVFFLVLLFFGFNFAHLITLQISYCWMLG